MNNWKRIIAAAGTAALLISNMGSVTQAVFADDDYKEQITLSDQGENDSDASTEDEISTTGLDGEGEPAEGGDNTSGTKGQEQGEPGDQNDDSQDDEKDQQGDDGQNDAQGQNGNGNQGGDQENGNGSQQGDENNGSEDSADDVNDQNGNTGSEGTENSENNANGQGGVTDGQNTENAGDTTDKKDGAEDGKKVSHALGDSLKVTVETRESSKRDVTRDDDGAYLYDLGETASTTITLSNPEDYALAESDDAVVRVYMQFTDAEPDEDTTDAEAEEQEADDADSQDDADSNDSEDDADKADSDDENDTDKDEKESADESKSDWHDDYDPSVSHGKTHKTGEFTIKADAAEGEEANEYSYTVAELEDGLYCYEIARPIDADTITLDVTSVYKEESYGGENLIWYVVLTADEAEAHSKSDVEVPEDKNVTQTLRWINKYAVQTQTAETENYKVTVTYDATAEIPEDAELRVIEYSKDSEEYQKACEETGITYEWLIDVAFYVGDKEIEPKDSIGISVSSLSEDASVVETDSITHFGKSGTEYLDGKAVKAVENKDGQTAVKFELSSLSPIGGFISGNNDGINLAADTTKSGNEGQSITIPTQPTYSSASTSGAQTGTTTIDGITSSDTSYSSDKATSAIEDQFSGVKDDDGKVLTDKSVVYGKDDYDAFSNYDAGTFGVTLSAMAQETPKGVSEDDRTPVDVMFVLDTSWSMTLYKAGSQTRLQASVNAINDAIKQIMDNHPANRVGVVTFSSGSWELLDLGRYTAGSNGEYITIRTKDAELATGGNYRTDSPYVDVASGLKKENGGSISQHDYSKKQVGAMACGTYTQSGIERGYKVFERVQDTSYSVTMSDGTVHTVQRTPIMVLLSDGEPTYCNTTYNNVIDSTSTLYGDGEGNIDGNRADAGQGIMGFYTIETAYYYKDQLATKYNTTSKFYTIGEGIKASGYSDSNVVGDDYRRAVLNPTKNNISVLNGNTDKDSRARRYKTSQQLKDLLENKSAKDIANVAWQSTGWSNGYYYIGAISTATDNNTKAYNYDQVKNTGNQVPINSNQYYSKTNADNSYADACWFGDLTDEDLKKYFYSILMWSQGYRQYDFATKPDTNVVLTDAIGTGMEVKGNPVLRFGDTNYPLTAGTPATDANGNTVVTYSTTARVDYATAYPLNKDTDAESRKNLTFDLSQITITVTTDKDGNQTVQMSIPRDLVPLVYPELYGQFYYKESPVRLIFQVGLTEGAIKEANEQEEGSTKTYYTNKWQDGETTATFEPGDDNKYDFSGSNEKDENTTGTKENYFEQSKGSDKVTQRLGNNGKLEIKRGTPRLKVVKEWYQADGETKITDNSQLPALITGTLWQLDGSASAGQGLTLTVRVKYTNTVYGQKDYKTETVGTYDVAEGSKFEATIYGAYSGLTGTYQKDISGVEVESGTAIASSSGSKLTVSGIKSNATVLVTIDSVISNKPTISGEDYQKPTGSVTNVPNKVEDFTLSAENNWQKSWSSSDLKEQSGHTYSYWVEEFTVNGYKTTIVNKDQTTALSPTDDNYTITIKNVQDTTSLKVNKVWDDGGIDHSKDSVTVWLYQDDKKTDKSVVLDADNNWTATFDNLPIVDPNDSTHTYSYSVQEEAVSGYEASYSTTSGSSSTGEYIWLPATGFEDGKTYLIVTSDSTGSVIGMEARSNGSGFAWTSANNAGTITVSSNETYPRYITDEEAENHTAMQWTAKSVGQIKGEQVGYRNAFTLQNVATKLYAKDTGQGDLTSNANGKEMYWYYGYNAIDAKGETAKRKPSNDSSDWDHIIGSLNDYFPLDNNHTGDANSQKAQKFYLYERVEATSSATTITITNKKTYELPETGGAGTLPIELGGSAAMLTAMFVGYSRRRRDRKEGET